MFSKVLREVLEGFNGKYVMVNIQSAISIPYVLPIFEVVFDEHGFMFDNQHNEYYRLDIWYETFKWISFYEDLNMVAFEIETDGYKTKIEIMCT